MKKLIFIITASLFLVSISGCDESTMDSAGDSAGQGGSLARFTISGNHLYTVDWEELHVFDISQPENPVKQGNKPIGFGIETIFAKDNTLYFGTQFGMYIYDITNPENPSEMSFFEHIYSCDPVVVDDKYAYVTLSTGSWCGRNTNELLIVDITNPYSPRLVKTYPMDNPKGLGIDRETLFLCDNGLKVFNVTNVNNIEQTAFFDINARDVIPYNNLLIVLGDDGINQYQYNGNAIEWLSKITTQH
jgi:hypothetical protein